MTKSVKRTWQQRKETLKFLLWGVTVVLVCFLLYRVAVNQPTTHLTPLTEGYRDSLMTIAMPVGMNDTLVKYGDAFAVHFNSGRGVANCTVHELTVGELNGKAERAGEFMQDTQVRGCPAPGDYSGSGMDRGHLVPVADLKWSESAMRQSFFLTNISPMHKALNEGGWAKLEEKVREWTARDSALLVFTGPIVSEADSTLSGGKITVPHAYYKIIMAPCVTPRRVIAFIYPNGHCGGRLREYAVSVNEIERQTGLDFFPTLSHDEQERLEGTVNLDAWTN